MARPRKFALTALIALTVLAAANPARAEVSRFSLGPRVGYAHVFDSEENSITGGVATRLRLAGVIGAELAVDFRSDDLEAGDVRTVPVQLSGFLYVTPNFHITAGLGWYYVDASLSAIGDRLTSLDDSTSDAGLHLGLGAELPLGPRADLTLDGRYVFLNHKFEDLEQPLELDADFLNVVAGVQIRVW